MTKLCPRGKAAAKRKFRVYPSAYANAYASKICAGKIKDPSGVKRKDFRGSKAKGGRIGYSEGASEKGVRMGPKTFFVGKEDPRLRKGSFGTGKKNLGKRKPFKTIDKILQEQTKGPTEVSRKNRAGGGLMEATARLKRQGLGMGGSVCKIAKRGQNRDAIGKNS